MEFGQKQTNSNNFAFNNIILNNTRGQLVIDKDTANMPDWNFNNTGEDNIYSGKKYLETSASFECFQNAPDADSKWLDNPKSLFEDYENMNFLPATNSILINRGKNADLKNDFLGCYRTDGQIDIGPFELGECLKCGDSICSELYETNVSCPRDCLKFSETCSSLGYECGFHIVNGEEVNCGDCEEPCEGDNCTPICSDSCSSLGYECGVQEICGQEIDCGGCEGACIEGKCQNRVCTETCSSLGYECGVQEICGQQVDCGDCEEKPLPQEDNTLFIILISILSILIILIISFLIRKYHIFGL
jgi:predicted small metal-binding protein